LIARRKAKKKISDSYASGAGFDAYTPNSQTLTSEAPMVRIVRYLSLKLVEVRWEARHGACVGLLAFARSNAATLKRSAVSENTEGTTMAILSMHVLPRNVLEEIASCCLCVLCLDMFFDFDTLTTAISPVKETSAQLLATCVLQMQPELQMQVLDKLFDFCVEVREFKSSTALLIEVLAAHQEIYLDDTTRGIFGTQVHYSGSQGYRRGHCEQDSVLLEERCVLARR
jgi:hypothetical protein